MKVYSLTVEEVTRDMNQAKEIFLVALEREGIIEKGMTVTIAGNYSIVISEKGFFGSVWDRVCGRKKDENGLQIDVVKRVDLTDKAIKE